jgi:hypothetical protein
MLRFRALIAVLLALPLLLITTRAAAEDYPRVADRLRPADFAQNGLQAESLLVIHYHRPTKDYDNWNIWCWPEGGEGVALPVEGGAEPCVDLVHRERRIVHVDRRAAHKEPDQILSPAAAKELHERRKRAEHDDDAEEGVENGDELA